MNYHLELQFEDGVSWLARIRRSNANSAPPVLRDVIIRSEVAMLQFLETTGVLSPKVFVVALEGDVGNSVGIGYILLEKMRGKALRWSSLESNK